MRRFWPLLVLLPLVSSCLELSVGVEFQTSTSGRVEVHGLVPRLAQNLSFTEGSDRVPWPASRSEWQTVADTVPGLALASWAQTDTDAGAVQDLTLTFASARALEGLFVVFKQKLTLLQDLQGRWTLTWAPQVPRLTAGDTDTRRLVTALWGGLPWTFRFAPPGTPPTVRTLTLGDLAGSQAPAEWSLSW